MMRAAGATHRRRHSEAPGTPRPGSGQRPGAVVPSGKLWIWTAAWSRNGVTPDIVLNVAPDRFSADPIFDAPPR